MGMYGAAIGMISIVLLQVGLSPLLLVGGVVFPLVSLYVWWLTPRLGFQWTSVVAFGGGLFLDLLISPLLGLHALAFLLQVGVIVIIENKLFKQGNTRRILSLFLSIGFYFLFVSTLLSWLR